MNLDVMPRMISMIFVSWQQFLTKQQFLTNRQQQVRVEDVLSSRVGRIRGSTGLSTWPPPVSYHDYRHWQRCTTFADRFIRRWHKSMEMHPWANRPSLTAKRSGHPLQLGGSKQHAIQQWQIPNNHLWTESREKLPISRWYTNANLKDLGIYISEDCKFDKHINNTVKTTQRISSWTLRTFRTRGETGYENPAKNVIVPNIEYGSVIWSPTNATQINLIENIQKTYTSRISEYQIWNDTLHMPICTKNYWDRLKDLEIYSLERWRERFIILYIYKFIIGLISIECFDVYVERGIKVQRKLKQSAKDPIKRLRQNSFYYRGPQIYNLLPECLRQVEEITTPTKHHVEIFKHRRDEYL